MKTGYGHGNLDYEPDPRVCFQYGSYSPERILKEGIWLVAEKESSRNSLSSTVFSPRETSNFLGLDQIEKMYESAIQKLEEEGVEPRSDPELVDIESFLEGNSMLSHRTNLFGSQSRVGVDLTDVHRSQSRYGKVFLEAYREQEL